MPFDLQTGGTDDENGSRAASQQELLNDKPRLDRLAKPDVVGDEKTDVRHVESANERVKLIVFDRDSAAEGRLKGRALFGVGDRAPANRVQVRLEILVSVVTVDFREPDARNDARARLDLPENLQFFPERVFVDRLERNKRLPLLISTVFSVVDVLDGPVSAADFDKQSRVGYGGVKYGFFLLNHF